LRALQLLVKQKKLAKNVAVPCIVRTEGFVEADSLAENTTKENGCPRQPFARPFSAVWNRSGVDRLDLVEGDAHVAVQLD
jgi:hypothetical protein